MVTVEVAVDPREIVAGDAAPAEIVNTPLLLEVEVTVTFTTAV
jgi:hypothetical protein